MSNYVVDAQYIADDYVSSTYVGTASDQYVATGYVSGVVQGAATLSASATVTSSALNLHRADASVSSSATVSSTATRIQPGTATPSSSATVSSTGAKIHSTATAAGCQLVATCDLAIASTNAKFATPGVNIGLFCSTPMVALSRNISNKHSMEMLITGDLIDAQTAQNFGLINKNVPLNELEKTVLNFAKLIASKPTSTVRIGKEAFYKQACL